MKVMILFALLIIGIAKANSSEDDFELEERFDFGEEALA